MKMGSGDGAPALLCGNFVEQHSGIWFARACPGPNPMHQVTWNHRSYEGYDERLPTVPSSLHASFTVSARETLGVNV